MMPIVAISKYHSIVTNAQLAVFATVAIFGTAALAHILYF